MTLHDKGSRLSILFILSGVLISLTCNGNVAEASPVPIVITDSEESNNTWPYKPAGPSAPLDPRRVHTPKRHGEVPCIIGGVLGGTFLLVAVAFVVRYMRKDKTNVQAALLTDGPPDYNTSFNSSGQMIPIIVEPNEQSHSPGWGSFPHRRNTNEPESPVSPYKPAVRVIGTIPASGTLEDQSQSSAMYQAHL